MVLVTLCCHMHLPQFACNIPCVPSHAHHVCACCKRPCAAHTMIRLQPLLWFQLNQHLMPCEPLHFSHPHQLVTIEVNTPWTADTNKIIPDVDSDVVIQCAVCLAVLLNSQPNLNLQSTVSSCIGRYTKILCCQLWYLMLDQNQCGALKQRRWI